MKKIKENNLKSKSKYLKIAIILIFIFCAISCEAKNKSIRDKTAIYTADESIVSVKSYGFIDVEGAKTSAIIVEYNQDIEAKSVDVKDYEIMNYVIFEEARNGFDNTIEIDGDNTKNNEGRIIKVYVNDKPTTSFEGGVENGKYVIIEVNTNYMLKGQNLAYTTSMMAGVKQIGEIKTKNGVITASTKEISNYTINEEEKKTFAGELKKQTIITTDKDKIILPEFEKDSGWELHQIGVSAFKAKNSYSEYTGKYEDFELPYSIYTPSKEVLEKNKGNVSVVLHMEHAGANDTDAMAAITSSKAAVKLSSELIQKDNPAIIIVPQIEESRRSTNDTSSSSEANTAIWELLDSTIKKYKKYINESRIYGTGQSMGGMTILNMAAQRDNFFAGIAVVGAQWSNNYNKEFQNNGASHRSPKNDKISFNGFGLDSKNYQNWYYMISDDNILVQTTKEDILAVGLWQPLYEYFEVAGVKIHRMEWDPYLAVVEQNRKGTELTTNYDNTKAGSGIIWASFSRGNHMSTWKYGYQLDYPFEWLFKQRRETAQKRNKVEQLKNKWLGRDENGKILEGSGTAGLNSAQFNPKGADEVFVEGWTPVSATNKMISLLPSIKDIKETDKKNVEKVRLSYNLLSQKEKEQITDYNKLVEIEKILEKN